MRELEKEGGRDHNGGTETERHRDTGRGREIRKGERRRQRDRLGTPGKGENFLRSPSPGQGVSGKPVPVWWRDRNELPQRSRRLWELESRTGGRGADSIWEEAVPTPSAFSSPLLLEAGTWVLEQRRTRGPPPRLRPPAPHSRSRSAIPASTGRPARLGAHVPRLLLSSPWTLCGRAAEPQFSSSSSSSGSSCGPSGSALGRRRRCSAERRRDPRRETSATPKVKSWRRAPGSERSPRPLPSVAAAAAKEDRREGGVGAAGEGWGAPCSLYPGPHC